MATPSSFTLTHLILLESNFKREWTINLDNPDFKNDVNLEISDNIIENVLSVFVKVVFTAGIGDFKEIKADIQMVGVFNIEDINDFPAEQFAKVNGPAIIFPFIREHLSSLSLKAGVNPILLQPINFVKQAELGKENIKS